MTSKTVLNGLKPQYVGRSDAQNVPQEGGLVTKKSSKNRPKYSLLLIRWAPSFVP